MALHLANVLLVFALVRTLSRDVLAAGVTALLFGLHPLQVESVAWVISRKNVLFLAFFLLSILAYVFWVRNRTGRSGAALAALGASVLLFLLSATSKSAAVTLPAVLVLVDYWLEPAPPRSFLSFARRSLPSKLLYLPVLLFVWGMTERLAARSPFLTDWPFAGYEWLAITGHNLFFYVAKALVPLGLGVFYPLPDPDAGLPWHFYGFAALATALVGLALWDLRRRRAVGLGLSWYLVTIFPMAILAFFFRDLPMLAADRFFYQSSIGLFFPVGAGFAAVWRRAPTGSARAGVALVLALALLVLFSVSARHRQSFASTIALYENEVRHHPSDAFFYRLALEYENAGDLPGAFRALESAENARHQIFFTRVFSYQLRISDLYRRKGDWRAAARFLESAIESTPNAFEPASTKTPLAYLLLAELHARAGEPLRAAEARARARNARVDPSSYFESLWFAEDPEAARRLLERRVAEAPEDAVAWHYLGKWLQVYDAPERGAEYLRRAAKLGFSM